METNANRAFYCRLNKFKMNNEGSDQVVINMKYLAHLSFVDTTVYKENVDVNPRTYSPVTSLAMCIENSFVLQETPVSGCNKERLPQASTMGSMVQKESTFPFDGDRPSNNECPELDSEPSSKRCLFPMRTSFEEKEHLRRTKFELSPALRRTKSLDFFNPKVRKLDASQEESKCNKRHMHSSPSKDRSNLIDPTDSINKDISVTDPLLVGVINEEPTSTSIIALNSDKIPPLELQASQLGQSDAVHPPQSNLDSPTSTPLLGLRRKKVTRIWGTRSMTCLNMKNLTLSPMFMDQEKENQQPSCGESDRNAALGSDATDESAGKC
jgi:hypothetical protein